MNNSLVETLLRRYKILLEVRDASSPLSQRDIRDRCEVSKSTAHRAVSALRDHELLRAEGPGYALTDLGAVLTDRTEAYVSTVERTAANPGRLEFVAATDLGLDSVVAGELTRGSPGQPLAPVARLATVLTGSRHARLLTNSVAWRRLTADPGLSRPTTRDAELVVDESVLDTVRADGGPASGDLTPVLGTGNTRLLVYEGDIPYHVGILDDRLCLALTDDAGLPLALLETDHPDALEWGRATFESYRDKAREVAPSNLAGES